MKQRLRPYQETAVEFLLRARENASELCYFVLPTGAGKTHVLAEFIRRTVSNGRVLVVVHRAELVKQHEARYCRFGLDVGSLRAGQFVNRDAPVLVAMVQSLTDARLATWIARGPIAALLIDECHHAAPGTRYASIVEQVRNVHSSALVAGCTATPFRADSRRMQDVLPRCVFARDISDMAEARILARPIGVPIELASLDLSSVHIRKGEFVERELAKSITGRPSRELVSASLPHVKDRLGLVFAADVAHAHEIYSLYRSHDIPCDVIVGSTPSAERDAILARWRKRKSGLIVNVMVLSEGFNEPEVSVIVLTSPTASPVKYLQVIGRGLRRTKTKTECLILDVTPRECDDRQVLLDSVLLAGDGMGEPKPKGPKSARSRQPRERNTWVSIDGAHALSIGGGRLWIVYKRSDGSGLWDGHLTRHRETLDTIAAAPAPEVLEHVHRLLVAEGPNPLTQRDAPWRDSPASDRQIGFLARYNPKAASLARRDGWTSGAASDAINVAQAQAALSRLRSGGVA